MMDADALAATKPKSADAAASNGAKGDIEAPKRESGRNYAIIHFGGAHARPRRRPIRMQMLNLIARSSNCQWVGRGVQIGHATHEPCAARALGDGDWRGGVG